MTDKGKRDIIIIVIICLSIIGWSGVFNKYVLNSNDNNIIYNLNYEGDD